MVAWSNLANSWDSTEIRLSDGSLYKGFETQEEALDFLEKEASGITLIPYSKALKDGMVKRSDQVALVQLQCSRLEHGVSKIYCVSDVYVCILGLSKTD